MFSFFPCCCKPGIVLNASKITVSAPGISNIDSENISILRGLEASAFGPPSFLTGGQYQGFPSQTNKQPRCFGKVGATFYVGISPGVVPGQFPGTKPSIFALDPNGAWYTLHPPMFTTDSMCNHNGTLVAMGLQKEDGENASVFRLLPEGWIEIPGLTMLPSGVGGIIRSFQNKLWASGFLDCNGTPCCMACWPGGGAWIPIMDFGSPYHQNGQIGNNRVLQMETNGNVLYVVGAFRTGTGSVFNYCAATSGSTSFSPIGSFTESFVPSGGFGGGTTVYGQAQCVVFHSAPTKAPLYPGLIVVPGSLADRRVTRPVPLVWWNSKAPSASASQITGLYSLATGTSKLISPYDTSGTGARPFDCLDLFSDGQRLLAGGGDLWAMDNRTQWTRVAGYNQFAGPPPAAGQFPTTVASTVSIMGLR